MDSYNEVGSKGIAAGVLRERNRLIWQEGAYITKRTSRCSCFCWTHLGACDHHSKCRLPQTKSMWLTFIDSTMHSFTITLACHINSLCWNQGKLPLSSIPKMLRRPYICKRMLFSQVKRSMLNIFWCMPYQYLSISRNISITAQQVSYTHTKSTDFTSSWTIPFPIL
jgi:hypothetical protein